MILSRWPYLIFIFASMLVVLHGEVCLAGPLRPQVEFVEDEAADEDGDDQDDDEEDEFEDEEVFNDNPWQIDERKLFAAKKFQLSKQYAVKIIQIDNVCDLDKKQKLKLKIASKGATEEALKGFQKQWTEQMQQFGGNFGNNNGDKKKKKGKKKEKRFVVNKVEEIDPQVLQMLDQGMFGGIVKTDVTDVAIWNQTVKKVLDEKQQKEFEAHVEKLKLGKRGSRADAFVSNMRLELALSDEQLEEFDELVRPAFLKKDIEVNWNYDAMATLYLGSKFNKSKMKKLLSDEQYLLLGIRLKPAENYGGLFGDNNNNNNAFAQRVEGPETFIFKVIEVTMTGLGSFADDIEEAFSGAFEWAR